MGIDSAYDLKETRNQGGDERFLQFLDYNQAFDNIDDIGRRGRVRQKRRREREKMRERENEKEKITMLAC